MMTLGGTAFLGRGRLAAIAPHMTMERDKATNALSATMRLSLFHAMAVLRDTGQRAIRRDDPGRDVPENPLEIREDDLASDQTRELLRLHLEGMHSNSPPGSVFA